MSSDAFKEWTEGVRNVVAVLAIAIGGCWTLHVFDAELRVQNAQAQLDKLRGETAQIEARIKAPLILKLALEQRQTDDGKRYLLPLVSIDNVGYRGTTLDISDRPLRVARVIATKDGSPEFGDTRSTFKFKLRSPEEDNDKSGHIGQVSHVTILPGQQKTLPFLLEIEGPGMYLVEFRARTSATDRDEWNLAGAPTDRTMDWAAAAYVQVK